MDDRLIDVATPAQPSGTARRNEMVAIAAYYRAERRGFAAGDAEADWLAAEAEIDRLLQLEGREDAARERILSALVAQLGELDAMLSDLRRKASKATARTRDELQKQLDALTAQRTAAEGKLLELRKHSGEAWEDLKQGVERAWQEMRDTMDRIAARFK